MKITPFLRSAKLVLAGMAAILAAPLNAASQNYLTDVNNDLQVSGLAFGDSITAGVGDGIPSGALVEDLEGTEPGPGYPFRVASYLAINIFNAGVPGEEVAVGGEPRLPRVLSVPSDFMIIFEGTNDAVHRLGSAAYETSLQKMVNVARASGRNVLLVTLPPPCCNHAGPEVFTAEYSRVLRNLGSINGLAVADVERAWKTTCSNPEECELLNLPEGLHPNSTGYDVIAQTISAALLGIDIFSPTGAAELEAALALPAGTVLVKPDA